MKLASVWVAMALPVALSVVGVGCSKAESGASGPPRAPMGKERGDCIAPATEPGQPKDEFAIGTCDPGLLCLSNLCVRPPPADCQAVADLLTSFDLGNYAELEERAPVVDKYKRACQKAYVSKEQGECIAATTDKMGAFQCAPLMFPEMGKPAEAGSGSSGDCDKILSLMRSYMMKSIGTSQDAQTVRMLEGALGAIRESCEQDGWPPAFKQCVLLAGDNNDAMNRCNAQMPQDIQTKLTERMMKIMQEQMPQTPPQPPSSPTPF